MPRPWLEFVFPRMTRAELRSMTGAAIIGGVVAGGYGALHDQITYSISPEYFTKLKFEQFHTIDFGLGDRVFVACIGFLATCWAGLIIGWFLARRVLLGQPRSTGYRQLRRGFGRALACTAVSGIGGFAYGIWRGPDADYSSWAWTVRSLGVMDEWPFIRVAYIHNASYAGGLVGLIMALTMKRPGPEPPDSRGSA